MEFNVTALRHDNAHAGGIPHPARRHSLDRQLWKILPCFLTLPESASLANIPHSAFCNAGSIEDFP
jgi:hypothetical protein